MVPQHVRKRNWHFQQIALDNGDAAPWEILAAGASYRS